MLISSFNCLLYALTSLIYPASIALCSTHSFYTGVLSIRYSSDLLIILYICMCIHVLYVCSDSAMCWILAIIYVPIALRKLDTCIHVYQ